MKIQDTPDYLVFADESKTDELIDFPNIKRGWGLTIDQTQLKPPLEWMNGAFNRIDKNILYLLQQGVPEWNTAVLYPVNAIIKYKGILYTATVQNDNSIPSTNTTKWSKAVNIQDASLTQKGIVQLSSATDSDLETKAATPKAVKIIYDLVSLALKQGDGGLLGYAPLINDMFSSDIKTGFYRFEASATNTPIPNSLGYVNKVAWNNREARVMVHMYNSLRAFTGFKDKHTGNISFAEFITTGNISNYLPVGIPQPWPTVTVPSGWLKCNGSTFDKALYPKLATAYPTGKLPDLRGEFIRGFDDGRGVDSGRTILSAQGDAIRNIVGEVTGLQSYSSGAFSKSRTVSAYAALTNPQQDGVVYAFNAANIVPTANENRPRNIAFLYIVKAE